MIRKRISISNKYGLHTRAAAKLVDLAKKFHSTIELTSTHKTTNCKSIMALMTLGAKKGSTFDLVVTGEDENAALEAIYQLIHGHFGEEE
jgi:phosphocarrier protein